MKISNYFPESFKNLIKRKTYMKKYDVILHKGSDGSRTIFEGQNILRTNTLLLDSFCGFGTTISENTKLRNVQIGKYCSIGQNVKNGIGMHPSKVFVSTHPAFYAPSKERITFTDKLLFEKQVYLNKQENIITQIGNDVWIGNDVTIFDGIKIGDGAIVGTGAIVTKDVLPYSIVGGVPAKLIRYRFTENQITFLMAYKWWEKETKWIAENCELFIDIEELMKHEKTES